MPKIDVSEETLEKIREYLDEDNQEEPPTVEVGADVIMRTYSAGVFLGTLKSLKEKTGVLNNAIRLWYWDGACSLSQLAMDGTKSPSNCKFAVPVSEVVLNDVIEVLAVTIKAKRSIRGTESWKK